MSQVMTMLANNWKQSLDQSGNKNSSIIAVRCVTLYIELIEKLGAATVLPSSEEEKTLFVSMLNNFDDPLQQLTLLDLLNQHFVTNINTDSVLQEWLSSAPIVSPILQTLQDPILSGAALQYISSILINTKQQTSEDLNSLLDFIKQQGVVNGNETERLHVAQALSNVSTSSVDGVSTILNDSELRRAWWDITHVSKSKLQAAIITSIALALPAVDEISPSMAMKMYNMVGPDNNQDSTTQWLFNKYIKSPIIELRIASYALLAAMLKLKMVATILTVSTTKSTQAELIDLLLNSARRESSMDSRIAYYDLLESFYALLGDDNEGGVAPSNSSMWLATMNDQEVKKLHDQLKKKIKMGPHGREPQRWDVGTE
jgi:hypothetical protein